MNPTRRQLLDAVKRLHCELKNTADLDVRFENLEKLALVGEVAQTLIEFENKLKRDLDVD